MDIDWKDITPLTEHEAKEVVKKYLARGGYEARDIDPTNYSEGINLPDLEVYENNTLAFYAEVKTPELNLNLQTGLYQWNTTINKLRALSRKAVKQLESFEPTHTYPRVIIFTSDHPQLNWTNCVHHIQGAVSYNGNVLKDFRNKETGWDLTEELLKIDLIIWLQVNYIDHQGLAQATNMLNKDSPVLNKVEALSKKLPTGYRP